MKTIAHRSTAVVTFIGILGLAPTPPQIRHLERFADLHVVAPRVSVRRIALVVEDGRWGIVAKSMRKPGSAGGTFVRRL